jgi:hypothetical protein
MLRVNVYRNTLCKVHCMAILLTLWSAARLHDEITEKVNTKPFIQLTTILCYYCTQYIYIYSVFWIRSSNIWSFPMQEVTFLKSQTNNVKFSHLQNSCVKPFLFYKFFYFDTNFPFNTFTILANHYSFPGGWTLSQPVIS